METDWKVDPSTPIDPGSDVSDPTLDYFEGTVFSPAFSIVEWKSYFVSTGDFSDWGPDVKRSHPWKNLDRKWIYLFQDLSGHFTWHGEYYAPDADTLQPVDLQGFEDREREDRPDPSAPVRKLRLAHTVNGNPAYYYAFASRIRLPIDVIRELVVNQRARHLLPCLKVETLRYDNPLQHDPNRLLWTGKEWILPAVDPLTIALSLAETYSDACDALIRFSTPADGLTHGDPYKVEERHTKRLLANLLKALSKSNPEIIARLRGRSTKIMDEFLAKEDYELHKRIRKVDRVGAALCNWIMGELFGIIQTAHFIDERRDAAAFINVFGQVVERLFESSPGKAYLLGLVESKDHFIHRYVLPESTPPDVVFQVARKCSSAIFSAWKQFAPALAAKHGAKAAEMLAAALRHISGSAEIVVNARRIGAAGLFNKPHRHLRPIVFDGFPTAKSLRDSSFAKWLSASSEAETKAQGFLTGIEVVNLAFALNALGSAGADLDGAFAFFGAVGSSLDLYTALKSVLGLACEVSLAPIGFASAIIDFFTYLKDMVKAGNRHDPGAEIGALISAGGCALTGIGAYAIWTGGSASATAIGISASTLGLIGVALAFGGVAISAAFSQSSLEVFANHCAFGFYYGSGNAMPWSEGDMSEWPAHPARQLRAIFTILSSIAVAPFAPDLPDAVISFGFLNARTRIVIDIAGKFLDGSFFRSVVAFHMWDQRLNRISGDELDLSAFELKWPANDSSLTLHARWLAAPSGVSCVKARCRVHLDYYGDGGYELPRDESGLRPVEVDLV